MCKIEYRVVKNPWRQKYFDFKNELGRCVNPSVCLLIIDDDYKWLPVLLHYCYYYDYYYYYYHH